ncbi:MarR family transcriptional regulator [Streptomyces sp. NPDC046197]|uniref:MarR family transcriptional regulator n=1 Tax=Streptomyces sp. NPDC046197 TaxID=3154337 RepID=UPI0033C9D2AE
MADIGDSLGRVGHDVLAQALTACAREGFTGELRVSGRPGGSFHLRGGLVVAAESPGAPGAVALLLRSGRLSGEQWAEVQRESGGARWPSDVLVARGYAGAAQLRVVCAMALHDAAFAIAAGRVDDCVRVTGGEPLAPVAVGEGPTRLLQDAARKLAALAALPYPIRPERERPVAAAVPQGPVTALQRELLAQADGRSTARDLAFRTGRGVYAVTVEVARMLAEGLLECGEAPPPAVVRLPPQVPVVEQRRPAPPSEPIAIPTSLPRRTPGASGITEALTPGKHGASWKGFFRLRNGTAK